MPRTVLLHDRATILAALSGHRALHVYAIGDLDDFFFPYTSWFAREEAGEVRQIVLLYTGGTLPVVLAIAGDRVDELTALLRSMLPVLPRSFYLHVTPGAAAALENDYRLTSHGRHRKMALVEPGRLANVEPGRLANVEPGRLANVEPGRLANVQPSTAVALMPADREEVEAFYADAYPENWFDPRMLETERYVGVRVDGALASVAGVHVYSRAMRVAALGNVATMPAFRGRGLGAVVTAALCRRLLSECDTIGLNVHADNEAAIRLYQRLGFALVGDYEEYEVTTRRPD
ncbi:MAG: GNAT family N-acetyltransferase [Deltaproteobacteria bacterium]|nr:GNAT family N-acetyltransferase [Deltaproteobacteria bacterium]